MMLQNENFPRGDVNVSKLSNNSRKVCSPRKLLKDLACKSHFFLHCIVWGTLLHPPPLLSSVLRNVCIPFLCEGQSSELRHSFHLQRTKSCEQKVDVSTLKAGYKGHFGSEGKFEGISIEPNDWMMCPVAWCWDIIYYIGLYVTQTDQPQVQPVSQSEAEGLGSVRTLVLQTAFGQRVRFDPWSLVGGHAKQVYTTHNMQLPVDWWLHLTVQLPRQQPARKNRQKCNFSQFFFHFAKKMQKLCKKWRSSRFWKVKKNANYAYFPPREKGWQYLGEL